MLVIVENVNAKLSLLLNVLSVQLGWWDDCISTRQLNYTSARVACQGSPGENSMTVLKPSSDLVLISCPRDYLLKHAECFQSFETSQFVFSTVNNIGMIKDTAPRYFVKRVVLTWTTTPVDQRVSVAVSITAIGTLDTTKTQISYRLGVLVVRKNEG
jgi:hypothetical protein